MKHVHRWRLPSGPTVKMWDASHGYDTATLAIKMCECGAMVYWDEFLEELRRMGYRPLDAPFWIEAIAWNRAWRAKCSAFGSRPTQL